VIGLYGALSALLGGVFFPVEVLPAPLAEVARLLPLRYALEPVRRVLLGAAEPGETLAALVPLAGGAMLLPVSLGLLRLAVQRGMREGTLGQA
jgi:ABC-2 type transport system permease protein